MLAFCLFGILEWRVYNFLWNVCKFFSHSVTTRTLDLFCSCISTEESFPPFCQKPRASIAFQTLWISIYHSTEEHFQLLGRQLGIWLSCLKCFCENPASIFVPSKDTALSLLGVRSCKAISSHPYCKGYQSLHNIISHLGFVFHTFLPLHSPPTRHPTTQRQIFWEMGDRIRILTSASGQMYLTVNYHVKSCHSHLLQPSFKQEFSLYFMSGKVLLLTQAY